MMRGPVRRLVCGLLLLIVLAGCATSEAAPPPGASGTPDPSAASSEAMGSSTTTERIDAPAFSGQTISGTSITGGDLWQAGPVVLVFFASWCGSCASSQQQWNELADRFAGRATFVGVVPDEQSDQLAQYLAAHPVSYQVISDPGKTIWRSYGVTEPPLVALIGTGGALLRGWPGGVDPAELATELENTVRP